MARSRDEPSATKCRKLFEISTIALVFVGFISLSRTDIVYTPSTLLFNTYNDIYLTNITRTGGSSSFESVTKGLVKCAALDYHYEHQRICWSDEDLENIQCMNMASGPTAKKDVIKGLDKPDGLAIDWYTDKIYWTDGEMTRIEVATLDGRYQRVLFWSDLDRPRAIALVPSKRIMIWTDWGETPKIEQASMDGDLLSRKVIVQSHEDIHWPNGLAVDLENELIYWVDGKLLFIDVMRFDGSNRRRIVRNLAYPHSLTYSNKILYWTDWKFQAIYSFDVGVNETMATIKTPDVPIIVKAWDPKLQPRGLNPCAKNNGNCSHLCLLSTNILGYSCSCPTGVKLISSTQCADGPQEMLFLVQRTQISKISLDSMDFTSFPLPLGKIKYAIAVDYDPVDHLVYWTDADFHAIRRASMDGSGIIDIVTTEVDHPDGLAIDWLARNIYWTDPNTDRIEVCRIDGSSRKTIIYEDLHEPRAIALAPTLGWMFWSDWNDKRPKIERASLDGSERVLLVSEDLVWPNGIALDIENQKLYWCDAKKQKIEVIKMDGSERQAIISDSLLHVFGLSLLGDYIYWTDWQGRSINRANKNTGGDRIVVVDQFPDVMGCKVARLKEVKGNSSCSIRNGGCSHLCFNRPSNHTSNYVCRCPIDLELDRDKKICHKPEAFLLFSRKTDLGNKVFGRISIELNEDNLNHNVIPIKDLRNSTGVDVHIADSRIYWMNKKTKCIMRAYINGSDVERIIDSGLIKPEAIAVDWLAHNIYWTDSGANRIEAARLDGSSRKVILWKGITEPMLIVLEPSRGYMYWTEAASDSIRRAGMDGSEVRTIVSPANHATGLTIDPETRRLYWACFACKDKRTIETSDWNGQNQKTLVELSGPEYKAVALHRNYIYWVDYENGDIVRANKLDGGDRYLVHSKLSYMETLLIFNQSQQSGSNQCSTNNGGCSHICLAYPDRKMTCGCPTHYKLAPDNVSCTPPKNFIIFSQKTTFGRLIPNTTDSPDTPFPTAENGKNIRAIEYDPISQYIYWVEAKSHIIKMNNLTHSMNFLHKVAAPYDLAVDVIGRLLFWSSSESNSLNVTSLIDDLPTSTTDAIDIGETEKIQNIAVHPVKRLIFWTDVGSMQAIYRARMDGANRKMIAEKLTGISAMTVDHFHDLVIFALNGKTIDVIDLNGNNRKNLVASHMNHVTSIAALEGFVYWVDELGKTESISIDGKNRRPELQRYILTDIIAVWTPDPRILRNHTCSAGRVNCSHICIATPGSTEVCSCPKGLLLKDDGRTCGDSPACGPESFTCAAARGHSGVVGKECIPVSWRCDGQDDCPDGSDELNCPTCRLEQFRCHGGECIDKSYVCDGSTNCPDGSDEADCCKQSDFQCPGYKNCISNFFLCDGWEHCADGGDETPELCRQVNIDRIPPNSDKKAFITVIVIVILIMFFIAYFLQICKPKIFGNGDDQAGAPLSIDGQNNLGSRITKLPSVNDVTVRMINLNGRGSLNSYDRNNITGASGSSTTNGSGSMKGYPLNPPPSPATTASLTRYSSHRPYRHYKMINQPPPPTPCSTDVCDESDSIYTNKSHRSGGGGGISGGGGNGGGGNSSNKKSYRYDEPYPPPPTPRSHYHSGIPESCPPSPSSRSSTYFAPLPPPPSPDHYSPSKGYT